MLTLLELSRGLLMESAAEPPGGVPGREDTEGDLGGAAVGLDLVRKRRACAASLFTSVSSSTACMHSTLVSSHHYVSPTGVDVGSTRHQWGQHRTTIRQHIRYADAHPTLTHCIAMCGSNVSACNAASCIDNISVVSAMHMQRP